MGKLYDRSIILHSVDKAAQERHQEAITEKHEQTRSIRRKSFGTIMAAFNTANKIEDKVISTAGAPSAIETEGDLAGYRLPNLLANKLRRLCLREQRLRNPKMYNTRIIFSDFTHPPERKPPKPVIVLKPPEKKKVKRKIKRDGQSFNGNQTPTNRRFVSSFARQSVVPKGKLANTRASTAESADGNSKNVSTRTSVVRRSETSRNSRVSTVTSPAIVSIQETRSMKGPRPTEPYRQSMTDGNTDALSARDSTRLSISRSSKTRSSSINPSKNSEKTISQLEQSVKSSIASNTLLSAGNNLQTSRALLGSTQDRPVIPPVIITDNSPSNTPSASQLSIDTPSDFRSVSSASSNSSARLGRSVLSVSALRTQRSIGPASSYAAINSNSLSTASAKPSSPYGRLLPAMSTDLSGPLRPKSGKSSTLGLASPSTSSSPVSGRKSSYSYSLSPSDANKGSRRGAKSRKKNKQTIGSKLLKPTDDPERKKWYDECDKIKQRFEKYNIPIDTKVLQKALVVPEDLYVAPPMSAEEIAERQALRKSEVLDPNMQWKSKLPGVGGSQRNMSIAMSLEADQQLLVIPERGKKKKLKYLNSRKNNVTIHIILYLKEFDCNLFLWDIKGINIPTLIVRPDAYQTTDDGGHYLQDGRINCWWTPKEFKNLKHNMKKYRKDIQTDKEHRLEEVSYIYRPQAQYHPDTTTIAHSLSKYTSDSERNYDKIPVDPTSSSAFVTHAQNAMRGLDLGINKPWLPNSRVTPTRPKSTDSSVFDQQTKGSARHQFTSQTVTRTYSGIGIAVDDKPMRGLSPLPISVDLLDLSRHKRAISSISEIAKSLGNSRSETPSRSHYQQDLFTKIDHYPK